MREDGMCENSGDGVSFIMPGGCWKEEATETLTIYYRRYGWEKIEMLEKDTLSLCSDCAKRVSEDARMRGYDFVED
jgi:hypothetical protein